MPTLVLQDVPASLYEQIERLAQARKRTPSDTVLEVLESAFRIDGIVLESAPVRNEIFLTEEITAPFTIPRPEGETVVPIEIADYIPSPHDLPDTE